LISKNKKDAIIKLLRDRNSKKRITNATRKIELPRIFGLILKF